MTYLSRNKSERYRTFNIPKTKGGFRVIHVPDDTLKMVQTAILTKILNQWTAPPYLYAFLSERNIPAMASVHAGQNWVVSLDIHNFFPSVTQRKVLETFAAIFPNTVPKSVLHLLSEFVTYTSFLPQGAPTSPMVSNLVVAHTFGPEVQTYCENNRLRLTIYADDLTVSTSEEGRTREDMQRVVSDLRSILKKHNFKVNRQKTKIMPKTTRQYVCGIVVNVRPNWMRKDRDELKARLYNLEKNGWEAETLRAGYDTPQAYYRHLRGRIAWLTHVNPALGEVAKQRLDALKEGIPSPVSETLAA
jgi:RNA-directed DNA polymerase